MLKINEACALHSGPGAARFTGVPPEPADARSGSFSGAARSSKGPPGHPVTLGQPRRARARTTGQPRTARGAARRPPWAPTSPSTPSPEARSPRGGRASSPKFCTGATTRRRTACSSSGGGTGKKRVLSSSPWRLFVALMNLPFVGFRLLSRYLRDQSFCTRIGAGTRAHSRQDASPAGPAGVGYLIWYLYNS